MLGAKPLKAYVNLQETFRVIGVKKDMQQDRLKDLHTKKIKRPRKNQFGEFCQWQEMVGFSVILDNFYYLIVTKTEWSESKRF